MTNEEKFVLDELSKEFPMVISTAYIYAKNYVKYGCDITKVWSTAVEQASTLERVKIDAQTEAYDSFKKDYEKQLKADLVAVLTEIQTEIEEVPKYRMTHNSICVYRGAEEYMSDINKVIQQKIDALKPESEEGKC